MPFRLVLRNLLAHPLRNFLTFGSVFVAILLLCMLRGASGALANTAAEGSNDRLWVQSAVSLYVDLPLSYRAKIDAVDGVELTSRFQWFGGVYQDESNFFAQFGIDSDAFLQSYPEIEIAEGDYAAFERSGRGCIIGADLASTYGWRVGDSVPIIGQIFNRTDGSPWEFTVEAIYSARTTRVDQQTLYFHYDYLKESLEQGAARGPSGAGVYLVKTEPGANPTRVMSEIDGMFENGPLRVQTTTDGEFARQFATMLGSVPTLLNLVGGAVLFAVFFAVLNTMLMAARERVRDIGIMKALGFTDVPILGTLLVESLLLCGTAGVLAVGFVYAGQSGIARAMAGFIPGFKVDPGIALTGLGIAVGVGLLSGLIPGWAVARLTPIKALRTEA
ncbi:MAG: ABC transporter permease [Planctomycetota bacterium]